MIYEDSLTRVNIAPRKYLNLQLREWFGICVPEDGFNENDKEYVFYDAMLQGRTCCATFELKKMMGLVDKLSDNTNAYRSFFENKWNLRICQQTIANKTFEPDNPETRLSMMFCAMGINMMPNIWKKFLDMLKVTDSSLSTTDEDVAAAVKWLVDNVLFQYEDKDLEEETPIEDYESLKRAYPPREAPILETRQELPPESQTCAEGATESEPEPEYYYEKMYEVLHHIAELSTVTNGGHTGCTHDPASWAEEFMRNVTALFSFDLTRHIRPDNCRNKFDRMSDAIVKRFDDRTGDNTVLSNIGSVLQIIKMLACVRRDNVQDHPTPHGYEYVIDYNKYWSMIKQLYGIDLSDTPKYTNDHRYHLMAALKGAAD
jgi:hypothetical protein